MVMGGLTVKGRPAIMREPEETVLAGECQRQHRFASGR